MRSTQLIFAANLLIAVFGGGSKAVADSYVFTPIGGTPTGINNSGQIVGTGAGGDFLRSPTGNMQWFDVAGGTTVGPNGYDSVWPFNVGLGINNLGEVVGNGAQGAFLRAPDGTIQWFSVPDGALVTGINDSHEVVGYVDDSSFATDLSCNPCGLVGNLNGPFTAFFDMETYALGINNSGAVVGLSRSLLAAFLRNPDSTVNRFLWGESNYYPGALGINNNGQIAGGAFCDFYFDPSPFGLGCQPFEIATNGFIRQTDGSFTFIDYPGAQNTILTGINDHGEIIGYTWGEGAVGGFLATPVPEPASLFLLGAVLACLGAFLRSRKAPRQHTVPTPPAS